METARLNNDDVRRVYKRVAPWYDGWATLTESRARNRVLSLAAINDGETILEVAVGTGILFEQVLARNPGGRSEGIDLTEEMINRARNRAERFEHASFGLAIGDARSLPFEAGVFDLVLNCYMFDLLPVGDFDAVLSEFRRVLKPGGRLVLSNMTRAERWYQGGWEFLYRRSPALLGGCRGVLMEPFVARAGFGDVTRAFVSQMTFPSEIIRGIKPK